MPLSKAMPLERSLLLANGKLLTAGVDAEAGEFVLARHLASGALDPGFGLHGLQRIASDLARSITTLSLRLEANDRVVAQGSLSDPVTGREGVYLLRILPSGEASPRLGVDAFLIISPLPTASAASAGGGARDEWTWLRWPSCQA
ncbi:NHL repeat-containing protein [Pseudomonas wadenswilerensis]